MRITRRFIVKDLEGISLSTAIRYERYYINDNLRIQKKGERLEKEVLDDENVLIEKSSITEEEFNILKEQSDKAIIRDSYLYLEDDRVSIKKYYDTYEGLNRVEVKFDTVEEMHSYVKEPWMQEEITESPLAFDKYLSKLNREKFLCEYHKYL